ncbi:MAG TPA: nicotinic acid mononucleotide adenylyltransferase, partial [Porphyromonadaceae bacterium]|nr:nicotinic acid mononucleotide adenylyltransferase [Porphyromonadaceae bacterium]
PQWKSPEQILKEYNLLLYPRRGSRIGELPSNVHYLPAPLIEISSTFLRDAFQRGKEYPFLLPQSIYASVRKYYASK